MNRRTLLAVLILALLVPATQAADVSWNQTAVEAAAGEETLIGTAEVITGVNESIVNISTSSSFPFDIDVEPDEVDKVQENSSKIFEIYASPASSFQPGSYQKHVTFASENQTVEVNPKVNITELNNWTVLREKIRVNKSIGTSGTYTSIDILQQGNIEADLETNITGNISSYLNAQDEVQLYPGLNTSIGVNYDLPPDLETGRYTGAITFTDSSNSSLNESVQLESYFSDITEPDIPKIRAENTSATLPQKFEVLASDNLEMAEVRGTVTWQKPLNYQTMNRTEFNESTVKSFVFQEGSDPSSYTYQFGGVSRTGFYEIEVTAVDEAGNNVSKTQSFRVENLSALNVTNSNFGFGDIIAGQQKEQKIFELDAETPVEVKYKDITRDNASRYVDIGLKKKGSDTADFYDEVGNSITVKDPGGYLVVARVSDKADLETFNAELELNPVEEHVPVEDVLFDAQIISDYPEPRQFNRHGLTGNISYKDFTGNQPGTLFIRVEGDASDCKGEQDIMNCAPGLDLGRMDELENKIDSQSATISALIVIAGGTNFIWFMIWIIRRRIRAVQGRLYTLRRFDYNELIENARPNRGEE